MNNSKLSGLTLRLTSVISIFVLSLAVQAAPVPIETSALPPDATGDTKTGIGFSVSVAQRPFIGVDDQDTSLPYIKFRSGNFYIEGINVGYKFIENESTSFEVLATPRFYEVKESFADKDELDGIKETKPTYLAGVSAQYHTDFATLTLQALADVQESDGYELIASLSKAYQTTENLTLLPAIGVTYQDAELVDHFYGVQANEVAIGRPEYKADASTNTYVSLTAIWDATKHIQLLGQIKYENLGSGTTDSPIVDEDSIVTAVIGAVYLF